MISANRWSIIMASIIVHYCQTSKAFMFRFQILKNLTKLTSLKMVSGKYLDFTTYQALILMI